MIRAVQASQAYNSAGYPAVEVAIVTNDGVFRASTTEMVSAGQVEGVNIYDEDIDHHDGKGVEYIVRLVNEIAHKALVGFEATDQIYLDKRLVENLDGTRNAWGWISSKLGRNTLYALSHAIAKAGAARRGLPFPLYLGLLGERCLSRLRLPRPMISVIGGGLMGGSCMPIESIFIMPSAEGSFKDAIACCRDVVQRVGDLLVKCFGQSARNISDDGGFSPACSNVETLMEIVHSAIQESGRGRVSMGLDIAASSFFVNGAYDISWKFQEAMSVERPDLLPLSLDVHPAEAPVLPGLWTQRVISWLKAFPVEVVIDPIALETDFLAAMRLILKEVTPGPLIALHRSHGSQPTLVNRYLHQTGFDNIVVSPAQLSSITETIAACLEVKNYQKQTGKGHLIVAAGHKENEDTLAADLALAMSADFVKIGGMMRGERTAKINQLLRMEELFTNITFYEEKKELI